MIEHDIRQKYLEYVRNLNIDTLNSETVRLRSDLKSTELMSRLKHRNNGDIIDNNCVDSIDVLYINLASKIGKRYYKAGQLVMVYFPWDVRNLYHKYSDFAGRSFIFSNFKKSGIYYWLKKCEDEPCSKILLSNGSTLKLWDIPFIIEAATNYDKDFRKEWKDGYLEYEGNEYGDTSTFYIIGCID